MGAVGKIEIQVGAVTEEALSKLQNFTVRGRELLGQFAEGVKIGFGIDLAEKFIEKLREIPRALEEAVGEGIKFNTTIENARSGIAGLLLQFDPGRFQNFTQALKGADDVIDQLKEKSHGAPLEPLIGSFQAISGYARDANLSLKQQVDLVIMLSNAARAIDFQGDLPQQIRELVSGTITHNSQLAKTLQITSEMVQKAKEEGSVYELIRTHVTGITQAAKEGLGTFSVLKAQVAAGLEEVFGKLMQPVFETLKAGYTQFLAIVKGSDFEQQLQGVADKINLVVKAGMGLAEWGLRNIGALADLFTALAVAIGLATGALTVFYARAAIAPLAAVGEKLQVLSVLGAGGLVSLKAVLTSLAGAVSLVGSAFAGWELGKIIDQWEVFGLKIGVWVQLAYLELFGGFEKIKSYLAGAGTYIEDTMAITWQRLIILTQQGVNKIAELWNKVPFMPKADTGTMQASLLGDEMKLEQLLKDRDDHLQKAQQDSANRQAANQKALDQASFETQFGPAGKRGKRAADGSMPAPNVPLSAEGKATIDEIDKAWRELAMTKKDQLELEYQDELEKIRQTVKDYDLAQEAKARLDFVYGQKRADLQDKIEEDDLKRIEEALAKNREAEAKALQLQIHQNEDALRLTRDKLAVDQAKLEANFSMTDVQKKGERIRMVNEEIAAVQKLIDALVKLRDAQTSEAGKESVNQQITGAAGEKRQLEVKLVGLTNAPNPESFGQQFAAKWVETMNQMGTVAERSARAFMSVWNGAIDKVTDGLTGMITGSMTVGQALTQIWQGVVTDIIKEFVRMAVQWVFLEIFKNTIFTAGFLTREGVRSGETASEAAHAGVRASTHAAGESAKTGSTIFGSIARKTIWLGETIFHGIQVVIRTVAYIASEALMTGVMIAQAAIRLPIILLESGKYLIMAAFKAAAAVADIPYVGPILAVAAIAAIIAAGAKAMGAFADGGIVQGPGGPRSDSVVARVSPGEAITKTASVRYWGTDFMAAINQGAAGARDVQRMVLAGMARPATSDRDMAAAIARGSGGGGAGGNVTVTPAPVQVAILNDKQLVLDAIASSAGKAIIVGAVNEARLKLGIGT